MRSLTKGTILIWMATLASCKCLSVIEDCHFSWAADATCEPVSSLVVGGMLMPRVHGHTIFFLVAGGSFRSLYGVLHRSLSSADRQRVPIFTCFYLDPIYLCR
ncbi:hypothetical protein BKA60DRAFT_583984 [Fusarium oxysporum]|nr:hypothetical protein BKA60DRAFT_583984 [Fusarium oxysporum]